MIQVLGRRWLTVAVSLVLILAAACAYLAFATPLYRASTSILLDARGGAALSSSEQNAGRLSQDVNLIESQVRLVSSPSVLARVVRSQHLVDDPEFNRPAGGSLLANLRRLVGAQVPAEIDIPPEQQVLAALAEHVDVKRSERTLVIDIEVTSREASKAARLADAVAAAFVEDQLAAKEQATNREGRRLDARLKELEAGIRAGERKVEEFKAKHRILDVAGPTTYGGLTLEEQQLNELNSGFVRARAQTVDAKSRLAQLQRIQRTGGQIDSLPESLRSNVVTALRTQYADAQRRLDNLSTTLGPRHPDLLEARQQMRGVQAQIASELRRITAGLQNDVEVAAANEAAAGRALEARRRGFASNNEARVDLRTLERAVQTDKASYDRLLSADNTLQQEAAPTPIGRPLAPALLPVRPASPNARAILLLAAAFGLAIGIAAALWRESRARSRQVAIVDEPEEPVLNSPVLQSPVQEPPPPSAADGYTRRFHFREALRPAE